MTDITQLIGKTVKGITVEEKKIAITFRDNTGQETDILRIHATGEDEGFKANVYGVNPLRKAN